MITPEQALGIRDTATRSSASQHAHMIDNKLSGEAPNSQGEWWYSIEGVDADVVDRLIRAYGATGAGWKVRVARDQRDGDALVFSVPESARLERRGDRPR